MNANSCALLIDDVVDELIRAVGDCFPWRYGRDVLAAPRRDARSLESRLPTGGALFATITAFSVASSGLASTTVGSMIRALVCFDFFFGRVLCPVLRAIELLPERNL